MRTKMNGDAHLNSVLELSDKNVLGEECYKNSIPLIQYLLPSSNSEGAEQNTLDSNQEELQDVGVEFEKILQEELDDLEVVREECVCSCDEEELMERKEREDHNPVSELCATTGERELELGDEEGGGLSPKLDTVLNEIFTDGSPIVKENGELVEPLLDFEDRGVVVAAAQLPLVSRRKLSPKKETGGGGAEEEIPVNLGAKLMSPLKEEVDLKEGASALKCHLKRKLEDLVERSKYGLKSHLKEKDGLEERLNPLKLSNLKEKEEHLKKRSEHDLKERLSPPEAPQAPAPLRERTSPGGMAKRAPKPNPPETLLHNKETLLTSLECDFSPTLEDNLKGNAVHVREALRQAGHSPPPPPRVPDEGGPPHRLKCSRCSFNTPLKKVLKLHEASHMIKREFKCLKCAFETKFKSHLKRHAAIHLKLEMRRVKAQRAKKGGRLGRKSGGEGSRVDATLHWVLSNARGGKAEFEDDLSSGTKCETEISRAELRDSPMVCRSGVVDSSTTPLSGNNIENEEPKNEPQNISFPPQQLNLKAEYKFSGGSEERSESPAGLQDGEVCRQNDFDEKKNKNDDGSGKQKQFACPKCTFTTKYKGNLTQHLKRHLKRENKKLLEGTGQCKSKLKKETPSDELKQVLKKKKKSDSPQSLDVNSMSSPDLDLISKQSSVSTSHVYTCEDSEARTWIMSISDSEEELNSNQKLESNQDLNLKISNSNSKLCSRKRSKRVPNKKKFFDPSSSETRSKSKQNPEKRPDSKRRSTKSESKTKSDSEIILNPNPELNSDSSICTNMSIDLKLFFEPSPTPRLKVDSKTDSTESDSKRSSSSILDSQSIPDPSNSQLENKRNTRRRVRAPLVATPHQSSPTSDWDESSSTSKSKPKAPSKSKKRPIKSRTSSKNTSKAPLNSSKKRPLKSTSKNPLNSTKNTPLNSKKRPLNSPPKKPSKSTRKKAPLNSKKKIQRTWMGEYACPDCSYRAHSRTLVYGHRLIHLPDKRLKCGKCSYATNLNRNLKQHQWTHLPEKRFKCEQCKGKFKTNFVTAMRKHQETNHGFEW